MVMRGLANAARAPRPVGTPLQITADRARLSSGAQNQRRPEIRI